MKGTLEGAYTMHFITLMILIITLIGSIFHSPLTAFSAVPTLITQENPWGVSYGAEIIDPNSPRAFELAGQAGIGSVRFTMGQERVEPQPNVYDFQRYYDRILAKARKVHLVPLIILGGLHLELGFTPRWNSTAPPGDPNYLNFPPRDYDAFGRYVYESVRRYPEVPYWEIWDEPDLPGYWRGSPAEYAQLLAVAYQQVKRANPQAKVLLGGLALDGRRVNPNFLEAILADTRYPAAYYFDIMNFHL